MADDYYLLSGGSISRMENTLIIRNMGVTKRLPIRKIRSLSIVGDHCLSTSIINFLARYGVVVHFFGHYGDYRGTFYPVSESKSGLTLMKQAKAHLTPDTRLKIAKSIIRYALGKMERVSSNLYKNGRVSGDITRGVAALFEPLDGAASPQEVREVEARAWKHFYGIMGGAHLAFAFSGRSRHPPKDETNAAISFAYALLYKTIRTELFNTRLDWRIGFVHSPSNKRGGSLDLDFADMYKPEVLLLVRKKLRQFDADDFRKENGGVYLSKSGLRKMASYFDEFSNELNDRAHSAKSFRGRIRHNAHVLQRHLTDGDRLEFME